MAVDEEFLEALRKRAYGFYMDDVVEEYELEENLIKASKKREKDECEKESKDKCFGETKQQYVQMSCFDENVSIGEKSKNKKGEGDGEKI